MDERLLFLKQLTSTDSFPVKTTFHHRCSTASGLVDVHYWPSKSDDRSQPPKQLTLFILGNPGMLDYYTPFLTHLHSTLPPSHTILSTCHLGHSTTLPFPPDPITLPGQLDAKVELVKTLRQSLDIWAQESAEKGIEEVKKPRLALMGHSLGGWISCEVMKRVEVDDIYASYLLFPSLGWIAESWNGRTIWPIFSNSAISLLSSLSPLLTPILPMTSFPPSTKTLLRSPTLIQHLLKLGKSEMELIEAPDEEWYKSQGENMFPADQEGKDTRGVFGVWSGGNLDGWVGRDGPLIRRLLGDEGRRTRLLDGVPHAFCLKEEHWEMVADVVAAWIDTDRSVEEMKTVAETPSEPLAVGPM